MKHELWVRLTTLVPEFRKLEATTVSLCLCQRCTTSLDGNRKDSAKKGTGVLSKLLAKVQQLRARPRSRKVALRATFRRARRILRATPPKRGPSAAVTSTAATATPVSAAASTVDGAPSAPEEVPRKTLAPGTMYAWQKDAVSFMVEAG